MNILIAIGSSISVVFLAFALLDRIPQLKGLDFLTKVVASFIASSLCIMLPLLFVGILTDGNFRIASWVLLLVSILSFLLSVKTHLQDLPRFRRKMSEYVKSPLNLALIIFSGFLILKYAYFLSIKGIVDPDAARYYLPFARSIHTADRIPLTSYNYEPVMKPSGISIFYAWIYSLSNSLYAEDFRLVPLIFVLVTMIIIYLLAKDLGIKYVPELSVLVYIMLPIHDEILSYFSYYNDVLYNAAILAAFFFLLRYLRTSEAKFCVFSGLSFGLSALMKAQTIYFIPSVFFLFAALLSSRRTRFVSAYVVSAFTSLLFLFFIWPGPEYLLSLPLENQAIVVFFIVAITTLIAVSLRAASTVRPDRTAASQIVKGMPVLVISASVSAFVWYARNYFLLGSLMFSTTLHQSNVDLKWAFDFLMETIPVIQEGSLILLVILIIVIPFSYPALGTAWIMPKIAGAIKGMKTHKEALLMIIWMLGYALGYFWNNLYHFEIYYVLNERDLYPLVPFLSIFAAIGIVFLVRRFRNDWSNTVALYILMFLGFISLFQSRLIPSLIELRHDLPTSPIAGLTGSQGFVISDLALLGQIGSILLFGLVASALLSVSISERARSYLRRISSAVTRGKMRPRNAGVYVKLVPLVVLAMSMQIVPYVALTYDASGGNIFSLENIQLNRLWEGLYSEVQPYLSENAGPEDVVVTVGGANSGLQYYLGETRLIELTNEFDLAALRPIIESDNVTFILDSLHSMHVRFILLPRVPTSFMQHLSQISRFLDTATDPNYFHLSVESEGWLLYESI